MGNPDLPIGGGGTVSGSMSTLGLVDRRLQLLIDKLMTMMMTRVTADPCVVTQMVLLLAGRLNRL